MTTFNDNAFKAIVSHYRESRVKISPSDWEEILALLFDLSVVGGDEWMADISDPDLPPDNSTYTVKTLSVTYPKTPKGKKAVINYCRDPQGGGLQTLANKCKQSLIHFKSNEMTEVIVTHAIDPEDPDYYQVAVYIKPQIDWTSVNIKSVIDTEQETKYYTEDGLFMVMKKPNAKREQTCIHIHDRLFAEKAVFIDRIYAPTVQLTKQQMIDKYEAKNSEL